MSDCKDDHVNIMMMLICHDGVMIGQMTGGDDDDEDDDDKSERGQCVDE